VFAAAAIFIATAVSLPTTASANTTTAPETLSAESTSSAEASVDLNDDIVAYTAPSSATKRTRVTSTDADSHTDSADSASTSAASAQNEEIWVVVTKVTSTTSDDTNSGLTDKAKVAAFVEKINDYWSVESGGTVSFSLGGFEVLNVDAASCTPRDLFSGVPKTAFDGAFAQSAWVGSHKHLAILTVEGCARSGLGTIGGNGGITLSGNGIGSALGVPVLAHELGHNLGFGHAGSSICQSTSNYDGDVSDFGETTSACATDEYGDYLDIMGYSISGALPHLSAAARIHNGYLSDYRTIKGTSGVTTTTVGSLDGSSSVRALEIVDPLTGEKYYVEFRTATGTDATSTEFTRSSTCTTTSRGYQSCSRTSSTSTGAVRIIRELPYRTYDEYKETTVLAAAATGSNKKVRRTNLEAGDTFSSVDGGFTLSVNSVSKSAGASISVRLGKAAATATAVALDTSTQVYGSSTRIRATATVNRIKNVVPAGSVTFYAGATTLSTVKLSSTGTAGYSLPTSLKVGKNSITARFTPSSIAYAASTSTSTSATVTKAHATARISLASSVKKSKHAKVTVTVGVVGAASAKSAPVSGKLYAYANGKKIGTYALSTSKNGKISITLPKLKSAKSITVKFSGSANVASATSASKKLAIRR
jgi:hypothetical protein